VPVPDHGRISVFSTTATKVIVRVRGYFTTSPYTDDGGTFTPVPPATAVGNVAVSAGGITSFRVTGANGVPSPGQVSAVPSTLSRSSRAATAGSRRTRRVTGRSTRP